MRTGLNLFLILSIFAIAVIEGAAWIAHHRQDLPWTELDLAAPSGSATAAKLAALGSDPEYCRALLAEAGDSARAAPNRRDGPSCGYDDGMILLPQIGRARLSPAAPIASCPIVAGLGLWQRDVVQPSAERILGQRVTRIDHAGSYSCRRLYGRDSGPWSEHAGANAFDVLGFRLADGTSVSVLRDWDRAGTKSDFLHAVRDGACRNFTTVLSPDYNAAHRDHLHLDLANRGQPGWRACR